MRGVLKMLLFIDSANIGDIQDIIDYFPIDGVSTNPKSITEQNKDFTVLLEEIRGAIGNEKELFVQTLTSKAEDIVEEAKYLYETTPRPGKLVVKIPVTGEGIKAIKILKEERICTMATAVYTPIQALIAAKAGASYISLDTHSGHGLNQFKEIVQMVEKHKFNCKIVASSLKNVQQVYQAILNGAHGVSVNPEIIRNLISYAATEANYSFFIGDWEKVYGSKSVINTDRITV